MTISYLRVAQKRVHPSARLQARRNDLQDAHNEDALDEALDESFPASDPVAVAISTTGPGAGPGGKPARKRPS